jgi:hypothetical protein
MCDRWKASIEPVGVVCVESAMALVLIQDQIDRSDVEVTRSLQELSLLVCVASYSVLKGSTGRELVQ